MFRSGFAALIGRPNVGKSTLLNRLVGQKIAITSPVAQTTRHRVKGVVTTAKGQIVFLDTPGFSKPLDSLGGYLTDEGMAALNEADVLLFVADLAQLPGKGDAWILEQIAPLQKPVFMILNQADRLKNNPQKLLSQRQAYRELFEKTLGRPPHEYLTISAKTGKNIQSVITKIFRLLPAGPAYYPEDAVTDQRLREISAEIIREKVLLNTQEEIPHSVAVAIETFDETSEITRITATLIADQKSQKGILIGKGGHMIKTIGSQARTELETLLERKVFLDLTVKIKENWRKDPAFLKSLGLAPPTT